MTGLRLGAFRSLIFVWAAMLLVAGAAPAGAQAPITYIYVTTLDDAVADPNGCSLEDAIASANAQNNIYPTAGPSQNGGVATGAVPTLCVPGGPGQNIIVLPVSDSMPVVFRFTGVVTEIGNATGLAVTPQVRSNITIQGNGATMLLDNPGCPYSPCFARLFSVAPSGSLTVLDLNIQGFAAKGGDGLQGGGGGLGAGGAIFNQGGYLDVERCTFQSNTAIGGNGGGKGYGPTGGGGGGGGLGGQGGAVLDGTDLGLLETNGGGGGGASSPGDVLGGDGGGIVITGGSPGDGGFYGGLSLCGGPGGTGSPTTLNGGNGQDGQCPGGGGGGGGYGELSSGNGGVGSYGGGGGGGASHGGNGGNGGFGGGGGSGWAGLFGGTRGGTGGFGGGGGSAAGGSFVGSGDPGAGGAFGGNANGTFGGGGGALGGAIFNDGGTLVVRNSTFFNNVAVRGNGGDPGQPDNADNGADAGGAIFSRNGYTTLQHVTVDANQTTGPFGGVYVYQDPSTSATPVFQLYNSIIFANGSAPGAPNECVGSGTMTIESVGNLIGQDENCGGVVSSNDPQLGALENNGGLTPTMAISTSSPALNSASASVALSEDQRGVFRPQGSGFDIGAVELCLRKPPLIPCESDIMGGGNPPPTAQLAVDAVPHSGGITDPPVGSLETYPLNSVVLITATPTPANSFLGWLGTVANPSAASTAVILSGTSEYVVAYFSDLTTNMAGNISAKSGPSNARVWTLSILDNGPSGALNVAIPSFSLVQTAGAACTPIVNTAFPLQIGTLTAGQTGSANVIIDFTGCAAAARFTATFTYTATNGTVAGSVVRANQFQ